jgi:uncharacterized membrane protein
MHEGFFRTHLPRSERSNAMSHLLIALSLSLHSLATVIFIGYYVLLALIYLPALQDSSQNGCGATISAISKRGRPWLYGSLLVFAITGFYLMLVDPSYGGIGNFLNPWSILMLVKHVLILGMVGMGFWFNAVRRVGPLASSSASGAQAVTRFRLYVRSMAASGVGVLLLTALAQSQ